MTKSSRTNFLMSVNGVQKCIMLDMFKKLQNNSEEHLVQMCSRLGILKKYKTKTDLLIRVTSYIAKPQNKEGCRKKLPLSIMKKLFPHEYREEVGDAAAGKDVDMEEDGEEKKAEENELDEGKLFDY